MLIFEIDEPAQAALFPNSEADTKKLAIDPSTGLYLNTTKNAHQFGSPYFGAVVLAAKPGQYTAQMHITNAMAAALQSSHIIGDAIRSGKIPASILDQEGQKRPPIILGYFKDPREAAFATQKIRFADNSDELAIEYFVEKLNGGLQLPWHEAIDGMPDFASSNIIALDGYKQEDYDPSVENRYQSARDLADKRAILAQNQKRHDMQLAKQQKLEDEMFKKRLENKMVSKIQDFFKKVKKSTPKKDSILSFVDDLIDKSGLDFFKNQGWSLDPNIQTQINNFVKNY